MPGVATGEKVAVTLWGVFMATEQVALVPLHAPLHPEKIKPEAGVAVSVTLVPRVKGALHLVPQLIPSGDEITVPLPLLSLLTDSKNVGPAFSHW
ncbi:protein of unknown function [Candidatus Nitrotoga arctica]|uniref:Uncharacterized protein n=1 Tax=Candidatus Nitrotoga arctica TaxID=453162 RepID=A0ABN8AQF2_9PROT|nr:protein of unknown function [Candidatus Nitrotoga arctica]